ncbi:MAG: hypothetical protein APF84_17295 [Gracilibacter sp. BRH_c7a]|nr:MAG: hypothetical protein APF84_17295 [Gracilibacter sp. BRH_c7a]
MAGEGVILKKAREEKGWTYSDVENNIKIRVRYLEAMENEDYEILPGPIYTKGFLRNYSRLLGLNPEEIVNYYLSSIDQHTEPVVYAPLKPIRSTPVWFKPIILIVMAVFTIVLVVGISYLSQGDKDPNGSSFTPTPLPTAPQTSDPGEDGKDTEQPPDESPVVYEGLVAELSFTEDCWLRVRVDGNVVIDGMRRAGVTETLQGTKLIEFLTVGNAGGLTITLNGKEIPPLGASREPVYDYVITEETLEDL